MIIYKVTNLINGRIYIGQTINSLEYRRYQHIYDSKRLNHNNDHFHNAIAKYGEDAFDFEIIDTADSQGELDEKERYWIRFYDSNNRENGYNEDEGGKSGGVKSQETKDKIGETTKKRWEDPSTAIRMMDGLRKASTEWRRQCKENRVLFTCPYCGREEWVAPYVMKIKTACSRKCKARHGGFDGKNVKATQAAAIANRKRNVALKEEIGQYIIRWCESNKQLVLDCPFNKISTNLSPLFESIKDVYSISDFRSLFKCFDVTNRKDFLSYLKNHLNK